MRINVILSTYNRCQSLKSALDSLAASALPPTVEWEVLVVDNNSTDQTREVIEGFICRHPGRFRYVFEPQPGKSYALNRGIRAAQGDVLAFTDDDVIVEPTWLWNLTANLCSTEWAGAGGRTVPSRAVSVPNWLSLEEPYNSGGILAALFDLGDKTSQLNRPPYGANMAFRKVMFEKYGGFRTDLGPKPGSQIRNEDTEFGRRLMAAGERLKYEPSATVYHPFLDLRVNKNYLLTWWFDYGRADVREWGSGPPIWGVPRSYLRILKAGITQTLPTVGRWLFALEPVKRFYYKCQVWKMFGWTVELYRLPADQREAGFQQSTRNHGSNI